MIKIKFLRFNFIVSFLALLSMPVEQMSKRHEWFTWALELVGSSGSLAMPLRSFEDSPL